MAQRGVIKIEEFKWRDKVFPIMLNKETGEFSVHIPNPDKEAGSYATPLETFRGELLEVKEKLEKYLRESDGKDLKWEAVILISSHEPPHWEKKAHRIDLEYVRGFIAKTSSGKSLWRRFDTNNKDDIEQKMDNYNSDPPYFWASAIRLDYTPERWSSLRLITESIEVMNEKLQEILHGGADKVAHMLHGIAEKGAQMLLPAPKKER